MAKKRSKKKSPASPQKSSGLSVTSVTQNYSSPPIAADEMAYVPASVQALQQPRAPSYFKTMDGKLLRLLAAGDEALSDCDFLELVLAPVIPSHNLHTIAIRLLDRFGTLKRVIHAERQEIDNLLSEHAAAVHHALKVMRIGGHRLLRREIYSKPIIQSWAMLMEYLKLSSGHHRVEEFRVLYLNHRHELIADEVSQRGTINHTPVYPREVITRAIQLSAAALILVHNHPSGDVTPSKADIDITIKIIQAAATLNISVHDHVIVSRDGHYSFKSFGLMGGDTITTETAPTIPAGHQYSLPF